jgi:class 3 adenylate cyclase
VIVCGTCGRESPEDFVFCPVCGATLRGERAAREVRKIVTVLFCDLTGSTAMGDRTDPEALRALMRRYYETARVVLERHGGSVEKFVGDAVMAVFGIPVATEDDALRAVRAAVELRDTVHELGLEARIGVNTGDVVAGEGDTLVTGDSVNVAARLEQTAGPGEILLGDGTMRLVRDATTSEPVSLTLKGKPEPVAAHRLTTLELGATGVARNLDTPLVGRVRERERLRADFADALASRTSRLFTLIGPAGVGKSRLVADFLASVAGTATIARGRALSYGEGITYWPLVEMLIQLGVEPTEAIRATPADTQLATRAIFEAAADERPLVLVLDDLQWAEPPMLDLIEHVVDWSRDAPILVLCIARPELLDTRPGWGGGKINATSVLLEPLGEAEAITLADTLLEGIELDPETRSRILTIAEGNPLFLEEMAALAREARGTVSVPPTIRALLQARLDTLNQAERTVIERGAVEGKVFHRGAVVALAPEGERAGVGGQLLALVRKELVRPDRSQIAGDDAFRFRHLLIRDTAYDSLPKAVRAELHERFGEWLAAQGDLLEQDELVGYHLERAAGYLRELDPDDPRALGIASDAAEWLGAAGHAAYERRDTNAAAGLLRRAHALLPPGATRRHFIPELVDVLDHAGAISEIGPLVEELDTGDDADRARAVVARITVDTFGDGRTVAECRRALEGAEQTLREAGDRIGLARLGIARAWAEWGACRADFALAAYRRAWDLFETEGVRGYRVELMDHIAGALVFAGEPLVEAVETIRRLADTVSDEAGPLFRVAMAAYVGRTEFMRGVADFDRVRDLQETLARLYRETGNERRAHAAMGFIAVAAGLDGNHELEEELYRSHAEFLRRIGDRSVVVSEAAAWATSLTHLGRADEALALVREVRPTSREDDIADQIGLDVAEGYALATLGQMASLDHFERARTRARDIVMFPLTLSLAITEAKARLRLGDTNGAREVALGLMPDLEKRGNARVIESLRREVLDHLPEATA